MTRYLRNQEGEFSTWAKGVLATLVIGFVGFTLTASARVVFGGPVEAKIQEIEKTSLKEDIKKLSDRMDLLEKQGQVTQIMIAEIIKSIAGGKYVKR